jgi:hypothetical protein
MPRPLNSTDNFETIKNWLDGTLTDTNSFTPYQDAIPQVLSKGIYFWFMKPAGYQMLSKHIKIEAKEEKYYRIINNDQFDLVYIGRGNNNTNNISEHLTWHINEDHNELSPLRKVISLLLSDNLMNLKEKGVVKNFIENYTKVFWIEYSKVFENTIDSNIIKLTEKLNPLLVKLNNPSFNEKIKERLNQLTNETELITNGITIKYLKNYNKGKSAAELMVSKKRNCKNIKKEDISLKINEINGNMGKTLMDKLKITKKYALIFKLFKKLPEKIEEEDSNEKENKNLVFWKSEMKGWRYTGSKEKQHLDTYFNNNAGKENKHTVIKEEISKCKDKLKEIWIRIYYIKE